MIVYIAYIKTYAAFIKYGDFLCERKPAIEEHFLGVLPKNSSGNFVYQIHYTYLSAILENCCCDFGNTRYRDERFAYKHFITAGREKSLHVISSVEHYIDSV